MMGENVDFYSECLENFQQITRKPTKFLENDESLSAQIKNNLKQIYDCVKRQEIKVGESAALPELIVRNFDLEQIWQQIELQNDFLLMRSLTTVSKLIVGKDRLLFNNLENEHAQENVEEDDESEELEKTRAYDNSSESEIDLSDVDNDDNKTNNGSTKKVTPSIVDDEFFKLVEMEQFLNNEEKRLNDPDSGNDSEENSQSEPESSIDLFEGVASDEDKMKLAKYKDFFVVQKSTAGSKFFHERVSCDEEPKSSYELRQDRLYKKIEEIEEGAIKEKPWQLKGEVTADNRPQNSLLEEVLDFDLTTRPTPVMTEQTTMQLEDIIKQRIKDKIFDSVELKTKPVDSPLEYKKKLVLDQEKSKESLAQIYEKQYVQQQAAIDPDNAQKGEKEPELHKDISSMMNNLFTKLDALSNFHFTPKLAVPELRIVNNLSSVAMEEVAPVATSDAALLAPEEIKARLKGNLMRKEERTATDKKRDHRKKKLKQKIHAKERQKKLDKKVKPGLGNKYSKDKMKKVLESVTKEKNVDKMKEDSGKAVKSSKAFFTQLQDEVKSQIKRKSVNQQNKKYTKDVSAKKLKL